MVLARTIGSPGLSVASSRPLSRGHVTSEAKPRHEDGAGGVRQAVPMALRTTKTWFGVVLDAPDGPALAHFYARLLGWSVFDEDSSGAPDDSDPQSRRLTRTRGRGPCSSAEYA